MGGQIKAPWRVDANYHWIERWSGGSKEHARVIGPNGDGWTPVAVCGSNAKASDNHANARRIVAAVNACNGISTEALESGVVRELVGALDLIVSLASQEWMERDGALRSAVGNDGKRFWFVSAGVIEEARAVLAKLEGN